jgi:ADP-ribose pyrophosphatase YjhB (NUDIX family)
MSSQPNTPEPASLEPDWLVWAREVQALAQSGLAYARDPYDRERYEALSALAARMAAARSGGDPAALAALFAGQQGYATPKIDVRGACFDADRILMVREVQDGGRWTLPGGWADVNMTLAESAAREVREESGFEVRVVKCAAAWDRTRQGHTPAFFSSAKLFYLCEITGGAARASLETSEVAFFAEDALPADLSTGRVLPRQLHRMFEHHRNPALPTDFE